MKSQALSPLLVLGTNVAAIALVAATAALCAPAFASGFGPATNYDPAAGAPASQRGVSTLTLKAEERATRPHDDASSRAANARPATGHNPRADVIGMNGSAADIA